MVTPPKDNKNALTDFLFSSAVQCLGYKSSSQQRNIQYFPHSRPGHVLLLLLHKSTRPHSLAIANLGLFISYLLQPADIVHRQLINIVIQRHLINIVVQRHLINIVVQRHLINKVVQRHLIIPSSKDI